MCFLPSLPCVSPWATAVLFLSLLGSRFCTRGNPLGPSPAAPSPLLLSTYRTTKPASRMPPSPSSLNVQCHLGPINQAFVHWGKAQWESFLWIFWCPGHMYLVQDRLSFPFFTEHVFPVFLASVASKHEWNPFILSLPSFPHGDTDFTASSLESLKGSAAVPTLFHTTEASSSVSFTAICPVVSTS